MRGALSKAALCLALAVPATAQEGDPVVIAALGDSLTQGYGLSPDQGFVPQLEAWLAERGVEARLINAGVSGDTTAGGLSRVDWTLGDEVDAMIVALGGNDMLRGIDPATSRANLDGILARAEEAGVEVLLVGMSAPGNYGPDYKAAFDGMYPELSERYGTLYADDFLGALADLPDRRQAMADYMQPDGIHPNADGVSLIVEDLGPEVASLAERVRDGDGD